MKTCQAQKWKHLELWRSDSFCHDLTVAIFKLKTFAGKLEREVAELEFISKSDPFPLGLNRH